MNPGQKVQDKRNRLRYKPALTIRPLVVLSKNVSLDLMLYLKEIQPVTKYYNKRTYIQY